ncbi:MAG TPA: serine hydrolase [Gemmatimonadales bacterium]
MLSRTVMHASRLLVAFLISGGGLRAQTIPAGDPPCRWRTFARPPAEYAAAVTRARHVICDQLARRVPGIQVAVAVDGHLVWSEGFGYADVETHRPITAATMFRIGSVSKPLTADVLALLVQAGKLDLDASIQRYVPSFPAKRWPITPRALAGHLAGIRGYIDDYQENHADRHYPTVTSGLAIFANDSLLFEPGTRFSYSTYGYSLLSAVLEGAAGQDFPSVMGAQVFRPLGLSHTALDRTDSVIPERAQAYEPDTGGRFHIAPPIDNSYKWAGGGVLSTAEDLVKFGAAHLSPGRLSQRSIDLLFTSMHTATGAETGYGVGWYVGRDGWGHRVAYHAGSAIGGSADLVLDRDRRVVFAMCLNLSGSDEVGNMLSPVWAELPHLFELDSRDGPLVEAFNTDDATQVFAAYSALGDTTAGLAALVEVYVNGLGYQHLSRGELQRAIDVFTLNTRYFPKAFNTWDSLAEAYLDQGDTTRAVTYYERSLTLNPANDNARRILAHLGRP